MAISFRDLFYADPRTYRGKGSGSIADIATEFGSAAYEWSQRDSGVTVTPATTMEEFLFEQLERIVANGLARSTMTDEQNAPFERDLQAIREARQTGNLELTIESSRIILGFREFMRDKCLRALMFGGFNLFGVATRNPVHYLVPPIEGLSTSP